jgi:hypothetical protein
MNASVVVFIVVYFSVFFCRGQFQFNFNNDISVVHSGNTLTRAFSGGLNNAQFSEIDVDFDGDMDLFVFDRSSDQIRVFINEVGENGRFYNYQPYGHLLFPSDVRYRAFLSDYDGDGKNDLFTYGIGGIKVYRNIGSASTGLQWTLAKNLLNSDYNGIQLNLYVSSADIPAIMDVDADGDLDILTFNIAGEFLQYHKNVSKELYGHADSLQFELRNECWGLFREDFNNSFIHLNEQGAPCGTGNVPNPQKIKESTSKAHAGSTVLALDYNGNGVMDLLLGDVADSHLTLLMNGGTTPNSNSAMISADPSFPNNSTPVNMTLFPAAFHLDVDFDGKKDLLVCPNARNVSENETSVAFYKNTSNSAQANFVFQTRSFLQNTMIDHGMASVPVLVDLNGDGLKDLIVGNYFSYQHPNNKVSRLAYYRNTGTLTNPIFTLVERDFLNLSQTNFGLKMHPTFGDLNGDGKPDLILGLENGTLVYLRNTSTGSTPQFAAPVLPMLDHANQTISFGQFATPQLFDLNSDGLLDLIIGRKTGELAYYQNVGTASSPSFELKNNFLGGVDVVTNSPDGFPVPHFFKHLDTTYLMVGAYSGAIFFYDQVDGNLSSGTVFQLRNSDFLGLKGEVKAYSSPYVDDIDNDGKLNLFIGTDLGGLLHLEHQEGSNLHVEVVQLSNVLKVYPNPFQGQLTVESAIEGNLKIYNALGKLVYEQKSAIGEQKLDLNFLDSGLYFLGMEGVRGTMKLLK